MTTSFHEAAKKGLLDPLREATKRDCNRGDETGMTPTLWAAYNGHVDALRLVVSRGGDPNKADLQGHTALHFAALAGHRPVVEFLVAFGCNLWALNNEYNTAMKLAVEGGKREVADLLDDVAARQAANNKKVVQKAKEKAMKDADERNRKYDKMIKEHDKKLKKEAERDIKAGTGGSTISKCSMPESSFSDVINSRDSKRDSVIPRGSSVGAERKRGDGDGTSLTGVPPSSESDTIEFDDGGDKGANYQSSQFWLPNRKASAMMSLPTDGEAEEIDDALEELDHSIGHGLEDSSSNEGKKNRRNSTRDNGSAHSRTAKPGDSISTVFRGDQAMWTEVDIDLDDEVDPSASAIELFLTVNDLADYIPVFYEEDIDMKALELLTEQDILELQLPLGPRRKLNKAIALRKESLAHPDSLTDSAI